MTADGCLVSWMVLYQLEGVLTVGVCQFSCRKSCRVSWQLDGCMCHDSWKVSLQLEGVVTVAGVHYRWRM